MEILEHHEFRVTRNEDVEIEEDDTESIIQALEKELLRRRFGPPIRLEISDDMDDVTLGLLMQELDITEHEVYRLPAPLDLGVLFELQRIDRPDLMFPKRIPTTSVSLLPSDPTEKPDIFASIARGDILLHHPYESFATSVQAFLEQAATDPNVLAIKQTLYRTSGDSPIIEALIDAAEAGKAVLALVEIKARFDEQANISWARKLEKAGVHVVYGMVGLKTHCKLALVVRQERNGGLKHYSHIGTGNYNPKTSRIYEDLGLLTADDQVGKDLTRLFNELSGYAIEKKFKRLLVAPLHLRKGLLKRIAAEASNAREGKPSGIRLKVNSMVDETIIDALYKASQAGVPIDIWVRGICSLRPGVEGLSETIRVRSILGRYLEHSRIFSFANDERSAGLHRKRRHDAPQPRPPGRDPRAPRAARASDRAREPLRHRDVGGDVVVVARHRRRMDPARPRREGQAARRPADRPHDADRLAQARGGPVTAPVLAAGAVCWKVTPKGKLKILVVHRTQHRDVSLPKGKVDPGETLPETAVREIAEETGLDHRPRTAARRRRVPAAERSRQGRLLLVGGGVAARRSANSTFVSNDEIESLTWMTLDKVRARLSYPHDVDIVDRFAELYDQGRARTFAIIALRHGKAVAARDLGRTGCHASPHAARRRPGGERRARDRRVSVPHPSSRRPRSAASARSRPTARITGLDVTENDGISQDAYSGRGDKVAKIVQKAFDRAETTVLLQPRSRAAADHRGRRRRDRNRVLGVAEPCGGALDRRVRGAPHPGRAPGVGHRRRRGPFANGLTGRRAAGWSGRVGPHPVAGCQVLHLLRNRYRMIGESLVIPRS